MDGVVCWLELTVGDEWTVWCAGLSLLVGKLWIKCIISIEVNFICYLHVCAVRTA